MSEVAWPFTWCTVHFAGAVEEMAGCLVWQERGLSGKPDCVLVQRLLVDREAIDYEAAKLWTDTLRDVAIAQGDDYKTAGILDEARHWLVVTLGLD